MADLTRLREAERKVWASVGVTPTERRVRLRSGTEVRVQEAGEGPPVLLVHGASNGGTSWATLVAGLDRFRCIALDRPGCCLSDPIPVGTGPKDMDALEVFADGLIPDVLDALELDRAHVVATSYGGYFAFRGAAAHPDRFDRLVEIGWAMGAPMTVVPMSMRIANIPGLSSLSVRIPPTRGMVRTILRQVGLKAALENGRFSDEMLEWFYLMMRDTNTMQNELRSSPRVLSPIRGQNPRMVLPAALLAKVTMPVQLIWGGDDPNGGEDVARAFHAQLPDSRLEIMPDAGHAPWIDEPERSASLIASFLTP